MTNYVHSKPKRIALLAGAHALALFAAILGVIDALAIVWIPLIMAWLLGGCSAIVGFDDYRFSALELDAGDASSIVDSDAGDAAAVLDAGPELDAGDAAPVLDVDASDGAVVPELDAGAAETCCDGFRCHPGCAAYWCNGMCKSFPCPRCQ